MQNGAIRVLVVGVGNMGLSHALAYDKIEGFELVGLCSRSIRGRNDLPVELASLPRYENVDEALADSRPDAVSINTYPNTHEELDDDETDLDARASGVREDPLAVLFEGGARGGGADDRSAQQGRREGGEREPAGGRGANGHGGSRVIGGAGRGPGPPGLRNADVPRDRGARQLSHRSGEGGPGSVALGAPGLPCAPGGGDRRPDA